jgi:hypothetical protein
MSQSQKAQVLMLAAHYCTQCRRVVRRSECLGDPDGLSGPELLCPHCEGLVEARLTPLGWVIAGGAAVVLAAAVWWLQVGA